MASDKAFPSKQRETDRVLQDHITASPVGESKWAKDVKVSQFAYESSTNSIVSATSTQLEITAHGASIGDHVEFTSGALATKELVVIKVIDVDNVEIDRKLSTLPSAADTVRILRPRTPIVSSDGSLPITSTPVKFRLDGAEQEVVEDTVTPANNAPLPVKLTSVTGDVNITAGDLNVQTSHSGASFDSMRIGDGTEIANVSTSNELQTRDDDANTALSSLLTELQAKADLTETQPVSVASLPLPTGAATEATSLDIETELQTLNAKDFATQTTLAALLVELQAKADLAETQPVSAASLPLPAGAATEATLASLDGKDFASQTTLAALLTELQAKADLSETQPVSAAALPLPTGASTEAKQDNVITELQAIKDNATQDVVEFARHDYSSVTVTTAAYTELVASTSAYFSELQIFDSSGQTLFLAIGAAASEVDKLYIFPGGNGNLKAAIPSGSRISIKAVSADADAGELSINFLG